jgi:hypothetical protein
MTQQPDYEMTSKWAERIARDMTKHSVYWQTTLPAEASAVFVEKNADASMMAGVRELRKVWDGVTAMGIEPGPPMHRDAVAVWGYIDGALARSEDYGRTHEMVKSPDGKAITHVEFDHVYRSWWMFWRRHKWFVWAINTKGERWLSRDDGRTWEQEIFVP